MQGELKIDQDNTNVETLPRAFDYYDDDFGDSMINLFGGNSESNAQDESGTVNPELGDEVASQEPQVEDTEESTSIVAAACSSINEANTITDPSSSSTNHGAEIPGSDQTMNRGMQQHQEANQIANAVPVSSGQNRGMQQHQVTFPGGLVTQAPTQRPAPPPNQQHPMFINPGPAQYNVPFGTNPNALMYYGPCPNALMYYSPFPMVSYVVRVQAPVGQRMHNQGNPNAVRGQAPRGPRMHNQGNPNAVRGQAPRGPRMHNQQDGQIVIDEAGPEPDPESP